MPERANDRASCGSSPLSGLAGRHESRSMFSPPFDFGAPLCRRQSASHRRLTAASVALPRPTRMCPYLVNTCSSWDCHGMADCRAAIVSPPRLWPSSCAAVGGRRLSLVIDAWLLFSFCLCVTTCPDGGRWEMKPSRPVLTQDSTVA